jgi:hypothetical protein
MPRQLTETQRDALVALSELGARDVLAAAEKSLLARTLDELACRGLAVRVAGAPSRFEKWTPTQFGRLMAGDFKRHERKP